MSNHPYATLTLEEIERRLLDLNDAECPVCGVGVCWCDDTWSSTYEAMQLEAERTRRLEARRKIQEVYDDFEFHQYCEEQDALEKAMAYGDPIPDSEDFDSREDWEARGPASSRDC